MTDMAYRVGLSRPAEPLLPRWWRTIDKLSLAAAILLFVVGLMLAFAASPPLAQRNGLEDFHYVWRQAQFGCMALGLMIFLSVLRPVTIRRLAVLGFAATFVAVLLLPWFGTDFGKGAVRWYSFGFGSIQPSEFLKPCMIVTLAWLMSASFDRKGPPGHLLSFLVTILVVTCLIIQPDFGQAALVITVWAMMYFVAGAPMWLLIGCAGLGAGGASLAYNASEHFRRRIDGFLAQEMDATSQIGKAAAAIQEGGVFGVGLGVGEIKQSLPDAHTDFHHCGCCRGIRAHSVPSGHRPVSDDHHPRSRRVDAGKRPV